jgi:hypothetical protein
MVRITSSKGDVMKHQALVFSLSVLLASIALPGVAQQSCWTVAGTSTIINQANLAAALQNGPTLTILGSAPLPAILNGRQSVTGILQDNGTAPRGKQLLVRYRDNGPEARITVELRQINLFNGVATSLVMFNSDFLPQMDSYQVGGLSSSCVTGGGFDFLNNLYFVNVTVEKTGAGGNPGLWMIQVCSIC